MITGEVERALLEHPGVKDVAALAAIKGDRTLAQLAEQLTSTPIRSRRGRRSSRARLPMCLVLAAATPWRRLRST
jgi:hypothetical protein